MSVFVILRSSASAGDQEKVRPSPSVYKQEAHTAPIVKTKVSRLRALAIMPYLNIYESKLTYKLHQGSV